MNPWAFGAIFGLTLFGGLSIQKFERGIAKDLGQYMKGDHKSIVVHAKIGLETFHGVVPRVAVLAQDFSSESLPFKSDKGRSQYGRVRHLEIEMRHFSLHGLPVEELQANIPNVRFDLAFAMSQHHLRIGKSDSGPISFTLRFEDIVAFAAKKFPQLQGLKMTGVGNRLQIEGSAGFAGMTVPFKISGVPTVQNGTKMVLAEATAEINGKKVDADTAFKSLKGFSSLLDLDRDLGAKGNITLSEFEVKGDELIGKGQVKILDINAQPKTEDLGNDSDGDVVETG